MNIVTLSGLAPQSYAIGGGSGAGLSVPFLLQAVQEEDETWSIEVTASLLGDELPTGFDAMNDPIFKLENVTGDGSVYAKVTFTKATGAITARTIAKAASMPSNTETTAHFQFGAFATVDEVLSVNNLAYGPITAIKCWKPFEPEATYEIIFGAAAVNIIAAS